MSTIHERNGIRLQAIMQKQINFSQVPCTQDIYQSNQIKYGFNMGWQTATLHKIK